MLFLFYTHVWNRGLKNELLCQRKNVGENVEELCQVYSLNAWRALEEGSGGDPYWIEYSYYPDLVVYWLILWSCYLFAEQQTVLTILMLNTNLLF